MLGDLLASTVDLLYPLRCAACDRSLGRRAMVFCDACSATLVALDGSLCERCGVPIDVGAPRCEPCARRPPAFARARAAFAYGGELATAIRRLKFSGRSDLARPLGAWLSPLLARSPDARIVPVPLGPRRLRQRGYNQAALLAAAARPRGARLVRGALVRTRDGPPVATLAPARRALAVREAFAVRPHAAPLLAGRDVVLVDDVLTTGATADACARALSAAGARRVEVVTLARALP